MMKQIGLFILSIVLLMGCSSDKVENTASNDTADKTEITYTANDEVTLNIEGMVCQQNCANGIKNRLKGMEGVVSSTVSFDDKKAVISFDNSVVKPSDFEAMIEKLYDGKYTVTSAATSETEMETESDNQTTDLSQVVTGSFELPNIFEFFTNLIRS